MAPTDEASAIRDVHAVRTAEAGTFAEGCNEKSDECKTGHPTRPDPDLPRAEWLRRAEVQRGSILLFIPRNW